MAQAGAFVKHQGIGRWWAAIPKNKWPDGGDFESIIKKYWDKKYGDRRQEIVFIGLIGQMNEAGLREELDSCLVEASSLSEIEEQNYKDPFPRWFKTTA